MGATRESDKKGICPPHLPIDRQPSKYQMLLVLMRICVRSAIRDFNVHLFEWEDGGELSRARTFVIKSSLRRALSFHVSLRALTKLRLLFANVNKKTDHYYYFLDCR